MKYVHIIKTLNQTFGFSLKYLILPIYRFFYSGFTSLTLALDKLFYPNYQQKKLSKPIFIIGHPRSGTTFLHRFLQQHCDDLSGYKVWQMMFPALSARWLIQPILPKLKAIAPEKLYDPKIHKTSFDAVETDDAALFLRYFDGLFFWIYFEAWKAGNSSEELEKHLLERSSQEKFLSFIEDVYQRNTLGNKQRMLSKSFSYVVNLQPLMERFSDGYFICLLRDPKDVIPSSMSLVRSAQSKLLPVDKLSQEVKFAYYQQLYQASILFYKKLHEFLSQPTIKQEQVCVVTYPQLKDNFQETIQRIITICEIQQTDKLKQAIDNQLIKQKNYQSKHSYQLEEFGLDAATIERDFAFIYENYDLQ